MRERRQVMSDYGIMTIILLHLYGVLYLCVCVLFGISMYTMDI